MRAGWMRPSSISFVSVSLAISRRIPSNEERTTAVGVSLLASRELGQLLVDLLLLGEHPLLDLDDPRAVLRDLGIDLGPQAHRILARADLGFAPEGVGLATRVVEDSLPEPPRLPEA